MTKMDHPNIGSNFDEFLQAKGILDEVEAVAAKRVLAYQIGILMQEQGLSKTDMARRMNTSRSSLDRLLDPDNDSVTLDTLIKAAKSLGKELRIALT